jgi:hypothetical protein
MSISRLSSAKVQMAGWANLLSIQEQVLCPAISMSGSKFLTHSLFLASKHQVARPGIDIYFQCEREGCPPPCLSDKAKMGLRLSALRHLLELSSAPVFLSSISFSFELGLITTHYLL